ncbi:MAG: rhomboid family intramembrane serine protease [Lachnospiraceae bacterium]|nr:rhomboid family intramembrane serine protease [Lachnospiraceae bacterium]
MQLRRDNEMDQERKSGPYYGMPSQKYENQDSYGGQEPYRNQDIYGNREAYNNQDSYGRQESYENRNFYENQQSYGNRNPYGYEEPYVVRTVPPVRAKRTIPIITILIIVANVIAAIMCIGIENTFQLAGINYEYITINHEYRRLISYMFIHADFEHLIGNMVALFLFGKLVEQRLGSLRMAIIYFGSGIGAGFLSMEIAHKLHPESTRFAAGASGAVFGIMCAAVFLRIMGRKNAERKDMIIAIALVIGYAIYSAGGNVDIYGHIGGAIVGGILAFALNVKKWQGFIENQFCKILAIIATVVLCVVGVGEAHIGKDQSSLMDKRVMYIREQPVADYEMKSYGTKTYGEALDDYCTNTKWESFTAESGEQVVQFNGNAYYKGSEKEVIIQFLITGDCESYELSYFAFDGTACNWYQVDAFFKTICD